MRFIILLALTIGLQINIYANSRDLGLLGAQFDIDGQVQLNSIFNSAQPSIYDLGGSYISLSANWKNKIRAVITGRIKSAFENQGVSAFDEDFSVEEFITEAYIEIRNVGGSPVAVIVGKHPIAFGQNLEMMPFYEHNEVRDILSQREVFGVTVDLTEGLFGLVDRAEVSLFETQSGDLDFGYLDGVSVRLSKLIKDNWLLTFSHGEFRNTDSLIPGQYNYEWTGHERRTAIGLVWQSNDGNIVGWVEGAHIQNNPKYPLANFVLTAGAQVAIHRTTDIVVEYNHIQNYLHSIAVGTKTRLTDSLSLGVELRYRDYITDQEDEIILGVRLSKSFGTIEKDNNEEYLFDEQIDEKPFRHQVLALENNDPIIIFSNKAKSLKQRDILSFVEASFLDDQTRIELFKKAGYSFAHYLDLKAQWIDERYEQGLKEFVYFQMLKELALNNDLDSIFNVKLSDFYKMKQSYIDETLSSFYQKGLGEAQAKDEFIKLLKEKHYPLDSTASNKELFENWSQDQAKKIYYSIFANQAKEVENHYLQSHFQNHSNSHASYATLLSRSQSKAKQMLNNKRMTSEEVFDVIDKYPELKLSINEIVFIGPQYMSYSSISSRDEGIAQEVQESLEQQLQGQVLSLSKKLQTFNNLVLQFTKTYSPKELQELASQEKQEFLKDQNFNRLVLAKLYELSLVSKKSYSTSSINNRASNLINQTLSYIQNKAYMTSKLLLEEDLHLFLLQSIQGEDYESKLERFFAWVIKFEVKRLFYSFPARIQVSTDSYLSEDVQKRMSHYLFEQSKEQMKKQFQRQELLQTSKDITVLYRKQELFSGQDLIDWLFP